MDPRTAATQHHTWAGRLVADTVTIWPPDTHAAWSQTLVLRLVEEFPARYSGLDVRTFGLVLRSVEVHTRSIKSGTRVCRGIRYADLTRHQTFAEVVYFAHRSGLVKIGTTRNVAGRLKALDRGDSAIAGMTITPVELMATMPGGRPVERALHRLFHALRSDGEWFRLEEPLVSFIAAVAAAGAS